MNDGSGSQPARVAVLIDCDNISWQRAAAIIAEAATHGVLGVKRGYGDWGSNYLSSWREQLTPLAIQPIQQIAYVPGKGATDIALVIDAMDLLHSGQVDTFCLVASDSDYTRLAMRLREASKRVVGIGAKQTPAAFSSACDRFTFVEVLTPVTDPAKGAEGALPDEQVDGASNRPSAPSPSMPEHAAAGDQLDLEMVLSEAVIARQDDDGWARLSNVGQQLVSNHPTFDSRNHGYLRLGQLVRDQAYLKVRDTPGPSGSSVLHVRVRNNRAPLHSHMHHKK